jgi:SpoVK/Ycf46/Vps4 family AAA+-type ATPase
MLEYFNGVLFLTTNRPSQIDEAFQSRIDVHIDYPNLDANSRRMIWKNFFSKSTKPIDIGDDELSQLAQISLNGRQIKNLVKQAQLISRKNRSRMNIHDINRVLSMFKTSKENEDAQASEG